MYYELLKPGKTVNIKRYQQQLTDLNRSLLEKRPERGNTKSFFFMIMLHHIRQKRFVTHRKQSAEKFYLMRFNHQTLLLPISTCLHRWVTHLLSSALVRTKM